MGRIRAVTSHVLLAVAEGSLIAAVVVALIAGTVFAAKGGNSGNSGGRHLGADRRAGVAQSQSNATPASPTPAPVATSAPVSTPTASPAPVSTPAPTTAPAPAADCSVSLQSQIDAAPLGSVLDLTGCTYAASATVSRPLTLVGATINVPADTHGVTVSASDVTLDHLTINGPQSAVYNGLEMGVYVGATPAAPLQRLTVKNSVISNFGYGGMYLRNVANFVVSGNTVTDSVYAGIMVLSGITGTVSGNTVKRVGVYGSEANVGNSYGISASTQNPATEPASQDITIDGNTVETVQHWEAMDTHGGQRITFSNNIVRYSRRGVMITTGSLSATDCRVFGNQFLSPVSIPVDDQYAVAPVNSTNLSVTGNTISGWGVGHDIITSYVNPGLTYTGNTITP